MQSSVLILPGLYNSGPKHWQSLWERRFPNLRRVEQADWDTPVCRDWVERLNQEVERAGDDVVLVAHSLACSLVAKWAEQYQRPVRGALLAAPSDTEADTYPSGTTGFSPMATARLPFRSIVVVSNDDVYVTLERATYFANAWGSELVRLDGAGHIGSDSNLGEWPAGLALLAKLTGDNQYLI
jgi:hypothetical protein